MSTLFRTKITTQQELKIEKAYLRLQADAKEKEVKEHFHSLADKVKPVMKVLSLFHHNKKDGAEGDGDGKFSILGTAAKVAVPVIAGRIMYKRGKKFLFKSLIGYGLQQGLRYLLSKNLPDHMQTLRHEHDEKQTG